MSDEIRTRPCACGLPEHVWVTWRGYSVGPVPPDAVEPMREIWSTLYTAISMQAGGDISAATACARRAKSA